MATRDPDGPVSVALVVGAGAVAVGALAAAVFVRLGGRGAPRGTRRGAAAARGVRRGTMVGSAIGLMAILRVLDGLTVLTAIFVIAPFVVAEAVLSSRRV